MAAKLDLSIVIVNFNTAAYLSACLDSIAATVPSRIRHEVIVVDNASTDGSTSLIRDRYPDVALLINERNVGFSAANNRGVAAATGRYVLFLNPDTVIQPGAIESVFIHAEDHPRVGTATCRVLLPDGRIDDGSHRGFPTPWNSFCYFSGLSRLLPRYRLTSGYTLGWLDMSTAHEIDALVGAFMLVRYTAGDECGWWDEDYFFYGEDLDFCYRLKRAGWEIVYIPDGSVTHVKGAAAGIKEEPSGPSTASLDTRLQASRARFDAMRIFYKKHYHSTYPRALTWLVLRAIDSKDAWERRKIERLKTTQSAGPPTAQESWPVHH